MIYRHDVDEAQFHKAMQLTNLSQQAAAIADLVIQRELQKVESRKAYRRHKESGEQTSLEG